MKFRLGRRQKVDIVRVGQWTVLLIAWAALFVMSSWKNAQAGEPLIPISFAYGDGYSPETGFEDIGHRIIPGQVEAPFPLRGMVPDPNRPRRVSAKAPKEPLGTGWLRFFQKEKISETSFVDIGHRIIPGQVEAPFPLRGMVPAPKGDRAVAKR